MNFKQKDLETYMNIQEEIEKAFRAGAEFANRCKRSGEDATAMDIEDGILYYINGWRYGNSEPTESIAVLDKGSS